jgi:hypothetical protein
MQKSRTLSWSLLAFLSIPVEWSNVKKFAKAATRRILLLSTKWGHVSAFVKQRRISGTFAFPLSNSHNPRVHFDT